MDWPGIEVGGRAEIDHESWRGGSTNKQATGIVAANPGTLEAAGCDQPTREEQAQDRRMDEQLVATGADEMDSIGIVQAVPAQQPTGLEFPVDNRQVMQILFAFNLLEIIMSLT